MDAVARREVKAIGVEGTEVHCSVGVLVVAPRIHARVTNLKRVGIRVGQRMVFNVRLD